MTKTAVVDQTEESELQGVIDLLGGIAVFPERPHTSLAAHLLIARGLPSSALSHLIDKMGFLASEPILQSVLGVSMRTVQRKKNNDAVLSNIQSGRTWKFAEIFAKAIDVFGSQEEAERWLDEPAIGLEGYKPIQLLSTPAGSEVVETFLDRLSFGIYT